MVGVEQKAIDPLLFFARVAAKRADLRDEFELAFRGFTPGLQALLKRMAGKCLLDWAGSTAWWNEGVTDTRAVALLLDQVWRTTA